MKKASKPIYTLSDLQARRLELRQEMDFQLARMQESSKSGVVQLGISWGLYRVQKKVAGNLLHNLSLSGSLIRYVKNIFKKK